MKTTIKELKRVIREEKRSLRDIYGLSGTANRAANRAADMVTRDLLERDKDVNFILGEFANRLTEEIQSVIERILQDEGLL